MGILLCRSTRLAVEVGVDSAVELIRHRSWLVFSLFESVTRLSQSCPSACHRVLPMLELLTKDLSLRFGTDDSD